MLDKDAFIARVMALVNEYTGGETVPVDSIPADFVAVRPTGPEGAGKVRIWPKPYRTEGQAPRDGEMIWAYAGRCSQTINPWTGQPCWQRGTLPDVPGFNPYLTVNGLAEMIDRAGHWRDWASRADLDAKDAEAERDRNQGSDFSGGR